MFIVVIRLEHFLIAEGAAISAIISKLSEQLESDEIIE